MSDERNTSKRSLLHKYIKQSATQTHTDLDVITKPRDLHPAKKLRSKNWAVYIWRSALACFALSHAIGRKYAALAAQQYTSSRTACFALAGLGAQQQSLCVHNATPSARSAGKYTTKEFAQSHIEMTQPLANKQNSNTPSSWRASLVQTRTTKAHFTHTNLLENTK